MAIFSLLALGLTRARQLAWAERVLILAYAGASGVMNFAVANDASPKLVLAYVMPPMFLAVVADQVSVARRHAVGQERRSPWRAAASLVLYAVRLVLASLNTAGRSAKCRDRNHDRGHRRQPSSRLGHVA